jgi:hypothetical protein
VAAGMHGAVTTPAVIGRERIGMDGVSASGAISRPRVVVSAGTSVDGRATLRQFQKGVLYGR